MKYFNLVLEMKYFNLVLEMKNKLNANGGKFEYTYRSFSKILNYIFIIFKK